MMGLWYNQSEVVIMSYNIEVAPTSKPLRMCRTSGCSGLTREIFCDECIKAGAIVSDRNNYLASTDPKSWLAKHGKVDTREHDATYDAAWRRVSAYSRTLHPFCRRCEERGTIKPREVGHHIVPIDCGGDRLNLDNVYDLCVSCHRYIHEMIIAMQPRTYADYEAVLHM
jgi:5-methylcytosine-specific restriction endonuclease McrA